MSLNTDTYAMSQDGVNWTAPPLKLPFAANWSAIAYGNGTYVTVTGNGGNSAASSDGIHWTTGNLPASVGWNSITFGNGRFVAVDSNTALAAVSTDGINWTAGTLPASAAWSGIAYGQGNFVTVAGNTGMAAISPDGVSWTPTSLPQSAPWNSVAFGNGLFVTVAGANGPTDTIAATSEDGIHWSNSTLPSSSYWSAIAYGNNQFVAVPGAYLDSVAASLTRTEINPPTVSLTTPTANQSFTAPATISLTASAASSFTGITEVQYFNGPHLIGSASQAPYAATWNNPPSGISHITAVATDEAGGTSSATVPVTVGNLAGSPLTLSLASPGAGQTQAAPASLTLTANISDSSGTVTEVAFFEGSTLLATLYQAPFVLTIPYDTVGAHSYTAQAIDTAGASAASAAVTFNVVLPGPLSVSLINANFSALPANTTYSQQTAFPVVGDASDGTLVMDQQGNTYFVSMTSNSVLQLKPDASLGLQWSGLNNPTGVAIARDGSGVLAGSASGLLHLGYDGSINTVNPNPDLGKPFYGANGVLYTYNGPSNTVYQLDGTGHESVFLPSGTLAGIAAMAFDSAGNMILADYQGNQVVRINPDKSIQVLLSLNHPGSVTPYGQGWLVGSDSGLQLVDGQWQNPTPLLSVARGGVAVQPNGNINTVAYRTANVTQLTEPGVIETSGVSNLAMNTPGSLMLAATTIDSAAQAQISQVGFYANGSLIGTTAPGPYTVNWNNIPPGTYSVTAQATDSAGNSGTSAPIHLTVAGPILTSPTPGQTLQAPANVVLTATATSLTGTVTEVRYYDNGLLIGSATQSPYTYNWNNIAGGKHSLTAVGSDSAGVALTSAPVALTVEAPLAVTLTSPAAGTMTGENVALAASVTEAGGTIAQVNYYNGTSLLGTATSAPYGVALKNLAAGTYVLTAQATDSFGRTVTSSAVTVTVVANNSGGSGGAGGEVVYDIHTDQLDTPRMVTNQAGNIVWQFDDTDPFGDNFPNQDPNGTGQQFVFNLRQSRQYADIETGTNYNYFRDYDPSIGRYMESDPLGLKAGINTYGYVLNNPLGLFDPFGLVASTIQCDGQGHYEVINIDKSATSSCTQTHEESHIKDWIARYGAKSCEGKKKGYLPMENTDDYKNFDRDSECRAYAAEASCVKKCGTAYDKWKQDSQFEYYYCDKYNSWNKPVQPIGGQ